jgi:hypothetical protein
VPKSTRLSWPPVLALAAEIVRSYDTGVTLRQLFYRLVAAAIVPNLNSYYRRLSELTAAGRRAGTFPELLDRTSGIEQARTFDGPDQAREWLRDMYRTDRTAGQPWTIYLGVEKAGLSAQLDSWFGGLGVPIIALGGYASQSLIGQIRDDIYWQKRPAALVYAGDHDPTGEDIVRDLVARVGLFARVMRVALTPEQVSTYNLPFNPSAEVAAKLERDPRAAGFMERHGSLVQYEVDALAPDDLRNMYRTALDELWQDEPYQSALAAEQGEREQL